MSGGVLALGGAGEAGRDTWITVLLCIALSIPMYYIYIKPLIKFEELNSFEINSKLYGNFFGKIVNVFYTISVFIVLFTSLARFTWFIKTIALTKTSVVFIGIFMALTCMYAIFTGFKVLAKFSEIMIWFVGIFLIFTTILSFFSIEISNIMPLFENKISQLLSSVYTSFAVPYLESFALIMLIAQNKNRKKLPKILVICVILSAITISIIFLRNLLLIGYPAVEALYYPSYMSVSLITLGDFMQRQEVAISITFLVTDVIKISVLAIYVCKSLKYLFKTQEYRQFSVVIMLLTLAVSTLFFKSTAEFFKFYGIYKYFLGVAFIILPTITFFISLKKFKHLKKQ